MWNKLESIRPKKNQGGLAQSIAAGLVCLEAEKFCPNLFTAKTLKNGTLLLEIPVENRLSFTLVENSLLKHLQKFSQEKNLPIPEKIRLTNHHY